MRLQAPSAPEKGKGEGAMQVETAAPDDLHFDRENPRFTDQSFSTEDEIIQYLYDHADVDELIQSILSAGYVDFEPMIVLRDGNVVLEGNRRLAALRLISREELRKKLRITIPATSRPDPAPASVRIHWVDSRSEARGFIGFKHINGPFKWDALAKAKYAAQWFEEGGDIATISRTLGDNHNTVRRLVTGWYVLKQALADGFDLGQISKKTFSFSHLYTALTRASVREYLGLSAEDLSSTPQKAPIPSTHREELMRVMSWLFGQEQKGEPTLIQSQNPNLNELSKVLGHAEARHMLLARRDLRVAYDRVEPASARFEEALMKSAKQCEDTMALSGSYEGDPTLLRVAEGLQKTTKTLVAAMRSVTERTSDGE